LVVAELVHHLATKVEVEERRDVARALSHVLVVGRDFVELVKEASREDVIEDVYFHVIFSSIRLRLLSLSRLTACLGIGEKKKRSESQIYHPSAENYRPRSTLEIKNHCGYCVTGFLDDRRGHNWPVANRVPGQNQEDDLPCDCDPHESIIVLRMCNSGREIAPILLLKKILWRKYDKPIDARDKIENSSEFHIFLFEIVYTPRLVGARL